MIKTLKRALLASIVAGSLLAGALPARAATDEQLTPEEASAKQKETIQKTQIMYASVAGGLVGMCVVAFLILNATNKTRRKTAMALRRQELYGDPPPPYVDSPQEPLE